MEVELDLLVFGGYVEQTVGNAFVNLSEVLWIRSWLGKTGRRKGRNAPILSSSCSFSALCTKTSRMIFGFSAYDATINSTSFEMGWL